MGRLQTRGAVSLSRKCFERARAAATEAKLSVARFTELALERFITEIQRNKALAAAVHEVHKPRVIELDVVEPPGTLPEDDYESEVREVHRVYDDPPRRPR